MVLNELQETIEKIREHPAADDLPDRVWEEINSVEDWEVYSSRESLPVLANFETDDPDLNQLVEEVYDNGMTIAELREFSEKISENPSETPQEGPEFEIETSDGIMRVYPVWKSWDGLYALVIESEDQYVGAEILILKEKEIGEVDIGEAIIESLRGYVEGE